MQTNKAAKAEETGSGKVSSLLDCYEYAKLVSVFTEIVATRLHSFENICQGVTPPSASVTSGWEDHYKGTPQELLPPFTIEINPFRIEVDNFVSMLINAVTDVINGRGE